jgi:hypothetical protein
MPGFRYNRTCLIQGDITAVNTHLVKENIAMAAGGQHLVVEGWVRTIRISKGIAFIDVMTVHALRYTGGGGGKLS